MAPKLVKKPAAKVLAKPQAVDTDQESMTLDEKMDMIKQNKDVHAAALTPQRLETNQRTLHANNSGEKARC